MRNPSKLTLLVIAAALFCFPMIGQAQGRYPDYGRHGGYGRYDERYLKDSIHRLDRLSKDFEREVDRSLDHSRRNGTRQEDEINSQAKQFRDSVRDLKSHFGNGRDLNRSRDEAYRVLNEGQQLERVIRPRWSSSRLSSTWSGIRQELRIIADAYGYNDDGSYRDDRGRSRDRDDVYRRRIPTNDPWWRRIPLPY